MKTFKQFLIEMPMLINYYDKESNQIIKDAFKSKHISSGKMKIKQVLSRWGDYNSEQEVNKISTVGDYHIVRHSPNFYKRLLKNHNYPVYDLNGIPSKTVRKRNQDNPYRATKIIPYKNNEQRPATYSAIHKKTGEPHMSVTGTFTPSNKKFEISNLQGHPDSTLKAHEFYHHLLLAGHVHELHSDKTQSPGGKKVWERLRKLPNVKMTTSDNPKSSGIKNLEKHYAPELDPKYIENRNLNSNGFVDYRKMEKDPEYKHILKLRNRKLIAKSKV